MSRSQPASSIASADVASPADVAMRPLHDFVPLDAAAHWRIADGFYGSAGLAAWTSGTVPSAATSNRWIARDHASFLMALAERAGLPGTVAVLEIGAGSGEFAARVLWSLEHDHGDAGRALLARLVYVLTDVAEKPLAEAAASPLLAGHVAAGRVVPALFDAREEPRLKPLGATSPPSMFLAVYANAVASALRHKLLYFDGQGWSEQQVRVLGDEALEALLDDPLRPGLLAGLAYDRRWGAPARSPNVDGWHVQLLRAHTAGATSAMVAYPVAFFDLLRRLDPWLVPGGAIVVTDVAGPAARDANLPRDPTFHGNTVHQGVDFGLFDAFGATSGADVLRTRDAGHDVSIAAILPMGGGEELAESFDTAFRSTDAEDARDYAAAALALRDDPVRAGRFWARLAALSPADPHVRLHLAAAAVDAHDPHAALAHADTGEAMAGGETLDFAFVRGRAWALLGRGDEAEACFLRSLEAGERPATLFRLGRVYRDGAAPEAARACFARALELDPRHAPAREALDALVTLKLQAE